MARPAAGAPPSASGSDEEDTGHMTLDAHVARGGAADPAAPASPVTSPGRPDRPRPTTRHVPTVRFRVFTAVVAVAAVALTVWCTTHPLVSPAPAWYLVAVYALYLFAIAMPDRPQRIVNTRLGDVPDILLGIPLLVLGPFPGFVAVTVLLTVSLSRRLGVNCWSLAFNVGQAVLVSAACYAGLGLLAPRAAMGLTWVGVVAIVATAIARELLGELVAVTGCALDDVDVDVDLARSLREQMSNVAGLAVACAAIDLTNHGSIGAGLSLAALGAAIANGELAAREANQRWLAEAVSVSGERIRAANTLDDVLDQLAQEVARLWRATQWRLLARSAHTTDEMPGRRVSTIPLVRGHEIVLSHPAPGVDITQLHQTTQTLVRMATERERVLRFQRRLELQASRDDLTGLGNRTRLWEMLDSALPEASTNNRVAAVYVDVDRFKSVNDTYGHVVGDHLLRDVAKRLEEYAGRIETPTRLSGDEFVLVITHAPDDETLTTWVHGLRDALTEPYDIDGSFVNVSFSIGIAVADGPMDRSSLIAATDAAVARAKKSGRGSVVLATEEVVDESRRRMLLETELRTALAKPEFELHYQPIVDTDTGRVTSVEALLRWYRDGKVWMRPDEFIQYAEEISLISQIGLWVLRRACTQMKEWNERYRPDEPLRVSVNVSTVHISQPTFVADVKRILEETGFPPELLIIEITETFALLDLDKSIALGAELKAMGVALWLDDFGTGYSSLEYVRQLPVEVVKLDRSFIIDLGSDATTRTFIESLVVLCRSIDRIPMAEGVERPEQRALLAELGCVMQQGYHFARPMPVEELADYVVRADDSVMPRRSA